MLTKEDEQDIRSRSVILNTAVEMFRTLVNQVEEHEKVLHSKPGEAAICTTTRGQLIGLFSARMVKALFDGRGVMETGRAAMEAQVAFKSISDDAMLRELTELIERYNH